MAHMTLEIPLQLRRYRAHKNDVHDAENTRTAAPLPRDSVTLFCIPVKVSCQSMVQKNY